MALDLELEDGNASWHMRLLTQHFRRAETALDDARKVYASLGSAAETHGAELHQVLDRIQRTTQQLADIRQMLQLFEDPRWAARAWR